MKRRAVILLSGGLDSAVTLFFAKKGGYDCHSLIFDYGQRHKKEIRKALSISKTANAESNIVKLSLPWKRSSLLDKNIKMPSNRPLGEISKEIPSTYVPARNTVFLGIAAAFAEDIGAAAIFIGAHFEDSSGYPDCRRQYLEAFQRVIDLGTKTGLEKKLRLEFPLIGMSKKEIIELGNRLHVPFQFTWSCYEGLAKPCMKCDSCILRARGFEEAGIEDPLLS